MLPEQFAEAYRDEDLPNVGEVSSGVKGDTEGGAYPEGPGHRESAELRGKDGWGQSGDDALRQES
jgi:hypothetical protein